MMSQATIPVRSASTPPDELYEVLADAGCLVVEGLASKETMGTVRTELTADMAEVSADEDDPAAFYPGLTRRVTGLMHRSVTARELLMHPVVEALGDRHLLPNCTKWQLNVSAALDIGPGARDQILHREEDLYPYWAPPRPNLILASMWAISDFTASNGGTQIVPGSHTWEADRVPHEHEVVRAEMVAGSVLFWLGGTLHGGGANTTANDWRYGLILTYNLGWLRQEEN
ncbi:MAG: phytanoyl-CoA dioxygenase family protein, partial [Gammaproteobacteria bacterium]